MKSIITQDRNSLTLAKMEEFFKKTCSNTNFLEFQTHASLESMKLIDMEL